MVAYAMHLLRTGMTKEVRIHPDGEHGKGFDFSGWLERRGFRKKEPTGRTSYGGTYEDAQGRTIVVNPKSGLGDVEATVDGKRLVAECKGGIINTRHPGQVSRLRRGLCEAVGLLMAQEESCRQVAVAPLTEVTRQLAKRLAPRCAAAGIELALVDRSGRVIEITPERAAPNPAP